MNSKQLFYKFDITSQIFYKTRLSAAFVNLKPIVPGHVLIVPQRIVKRFADLTHDEVSDLFLAAQRVGGVVQNVWDATSLTVSMQDGEQMLKHAGQSVPHVHVHVLPRKPGDFPQNDQIYDELNKQQLEEVWKKRLTMDADRQPRSSQEMEDEAQFLSKYFENV